MKGLLCFLLCLLLLPAAQAEGMDVEKMEMTWPEENAWVANLGAGQTLIYWPGQNLGVPYLYDYLTGWKKPLLAQGAAWAEILEAGWERMGADAVKIQRLLEMQENNGQLPAWGWRVEQVWPGEQYVLLGMNYATVLLHRQTGEARPLTGITPLALLPDDTLVLWEIGAAHYSLLHLPTMESRYVMMEIPHGFSPYRLQVNGQSAAVLLREEQIKPAFDTPIDHCVAFLDGEGDVLSLTSLGEYILLQGPDSILLQGDEQALVYWRTRMDRPVLMADAHQADVRTLLFDGESFSIGSWILPQEALYPLGVSRDGDQLLILDLKGSLWLVGKDAYWQRRLLSREEMEALGLSPAELSACTWDGQGILCSPTGEWWEIIKR